jgi:hypothetical protein
MMVSGNPTLRIRSAFRLNVETSGGRLTVSLACDLATLKRAVLALTVASTWLVQFTYLAQTGTRGHGVLASA